MENNSKSAEPQKNSHGRIEGQKEKIEEKNSDNEVQRDAIEAPSTGYEAPKVKIEIKRHQQLFELLSNPHKMWRVLLSMAFIIIVIFWGVAFVVIAIKKYYPYSAIETNINGAITMKTEDKEVTYWLFNSADLWANSGIEVKKGDVLTIRASGSSFTAIHHLVDASEKNFKPEDEWVGTEGQHKYSERDRLRAESRINKDYDEGILLMQIIPSDSVKKHTDYINPYSDFLRDGQIEIIGKERIDLRISKDGILHFAVNDIVLTDSVLDSMYREWIESLVNYGIIKKETEKDCNNGLDNELFENNKSLINNWEDTLKSIIINHQQASVGKQHHKFYNVLYNLVVTIIQKGDTIDTALYKNIITKEIQKIGLSPGRYPKRVCDSCYGAYPLINELNYYKKEHFYNAWYVDNIGSFLIVIERKKQ